MVNQTKILLSDVYSKRKLIAKKGDKVKVIFISEPAVIVEFNNETFSTSINNLSGAE